MPTLDPTSPPPAPKAALSTPVRHRARPAGAVGSVRSNGLRDLAVTWRAITELTPARRNARRHSAKQIAQIGASIQEFGFTNPVLVDETGRIMAGHGRVEAAKSLGHTQVPTIRLDHMSEAQKRAFIVADNRLAELAGWDSELLAIEFAELSALEIDFDLEITGFETAEIDRLIETAGLEPDEDPADAVQAPDGPAVSRPGDLWLLGEHRLLCGDALNPVSYRRLMGAERARLVFTDAPYNVPVQGHVCGNGRIRHAEFAMASGEMTEAEFTQFLARSLTNMAQVCRDGAVIYACMDHRHAFALLQASRHARLGYLNLCVWNKENGGLGSFYRSKHELVFVFKAGTAPHVNTIQLGQHGRYRTNVWDYAGVNSFRPGRLEELEMHPTVKPVSLVADAIKDASRRGEIVLDGFGGSGTTLIAAEKTGRRARLIELEPRFVDVAIGRYQKLTGRTARHAETGQGFDERQLQAKAAAGA